MDLIAPILFNVSSPYSTISPFCKWKVRQGLRVPLLYITVGNYGGLTLLVPSVLPYPLPEVAATTAGRERFELNMRSFPSCCTLYSSLSANFSSPEVNTQSCELEWLRYSQIFFLPFLLQSWLPAGEGWGRELTVVMCKTAPATFSKTYSQSLKN